MASSNRSSDPALQPELETQLPVPRDIATLAHFLDDQFQLPGTTYRFGFDGLIGLVPVIGDTVGALLGSYIVFRARELGVPRRILLRMVANLGIDWAVGLVPLAGDALDFAWKAHRRNLALLIKHLPDPVGTRTVPAERVDEA